MAADLDDTRQRAYDFLAPFLGALTPTERLALHRRLEPRAADYDRVFVPPFAALARAAYEPLWQGMQPFIVGAPDSVLTVHAAEASDFATGHPRAQEFPGGYAQIADLLVPEIVWIGFRLTDPGESHGKSYDGLVRLDDRFVLFPKPFRYIRRAGADEVNEAWSK